MFIILKTTNEWINQNDNSFQCTSEGKEQISVDVEY